MVREAAGSKLEQVDLESVMRMMEMVMRGEKLVQPFGDQGVSMLSPNFHFEYFIGFVFICISDMVSREAIYLLQLFCAVMRVVK